MKARLVLATLVALWMVAAGTVRADRAVHIDNPSFQEQVFPVWPGYIGGEGMDGNATIFNPDSVTGWDFTPNPGNAGINPGGEGGYRFADNGLLPDTNAVLFMQQPGSLAQAINGLEPGKPYSLQFYFNARSQNGSVGVPGDSGIPNASIFFDGVNLLGDGAFTPITPVEDAGVRTQPWWFFQQTVTPTGETADLMFVVDSISPAPEGGSQDGTFLIDAVSLTEWDENDVVIQNPSFEASGFGSPWPGYHSTNESSVGITGWTSELGVGGGTNPTLDDAGQPSSPFADNGVTPDGENVGFMQGNMSLSQQIDGLVVDEQYEITFAYNGRAHDSGWNGVGHLTVTLDAETVRDTDLEPVDPAGTVDTADYEHTSTFTAPPESMLLTFAQSGLPADLDPPADETILIDNVAIRLAGGGTLLGDVNGDGVVNGLDVDPFVDVLLNGPYQAEADMNEDAVVNGLDVDPFVDAVVGAGSQAVPEPSTVLMLVIGLLAVGVVRRGV
jgi:hypothetical protein